MPFAARANLRLTAHSGAFRVVEAGELCGGRAGLGRDFDGPRAAFDPILCHGIVTGDITHTNTGAEGVSVRGGCSVADANAIAGNWLVVVNSSLRIA